MDANYEPPRLYFVLTEPMPLQEFLERYVYPQVFYVR